MRLNKCVSIHRRGQLVWLVVCIQHTRTYLYNIIYRYVIFMVLFLFSLLTVTHHKNPFKIHTTRRVICRGILAGVRVPSTRHSRTDVTGSLYPNC